MAAMLLDLGLVVTAAIGYTGKVIDLFISQPILLIQVGVMLTGFGAGLFGRLMGTR